jgi:hypothetical protein
LVLVVGVDFACGGAAGAGSFAGGGADDDGGLDGAAVTERGFVLEDPPCTVVVTCVRTVVAPEGTAEGAEPAAGDPSW